MAIIETKYNVGDTVYYGTTSYKEEYIECPDCLGTKIVHITFADKRVEELACYTCRTYGYPETSIGKLSFKVWRTNVMSGQISSVEFSEGKTAYKVNLGYEIYDSGNMHEAIYHLEESEIFDDINHALVRAEEELERHTAYQLEQLTKKKGNFATRLHDSNLGFCRREALKKERDVKRWLTAIKGK